MAGQEIEELVKYLARLPGLGPRSARRAVLQLMRRRETLLNPLTDALLAARDAIKTCQICGNIDTQDPCAICTDPRRDGSVICVVEDVGDLWALERAKALNGRYHVLGGTLSAKPTACARLFWQPTPRSRGKQPRIIFPTCWHPCRLPSRG